MDLHTIEKIKGNHKSYKRVGRGIGSGKGGHTTGKGSKGQKVRSGHTIPFGFEGGQVPLYKRLPQIGGFKSKRRARIISIPLSTLDLFKDGETVDKVKLLEAGIIKGQKSFKVKILGNGNLTKKVTVKGFLFSKSAKEKAEKAGAKIS